MYADDTTIYCIGEDVDQAVGQLKSARRLLYLGLVSPGLLHQSASAILSLIELANPDYLALWWTIS